MSEPAPPFPQLIASGIRVERGAGWHTARTLSGYPELEWCSGLFVQRAWMLSGRIPALFYEWLSGWETTRQATWISISLEGPQTARLRPMTSFGFEFFDSMYYTATGVLTLPTGQESSRGRHWVHAAGASGGDRLNFENSWGSHWGNGGYGYMDREYFEAYCDSVQVRWPSIAGSSPAMWEAVMHHKGRRGSWRWEDVLACWDTPNPWWEETVNIGGRAHSLVHWQVVSLERMRLVDVLEVRNSLRVVGRAHLFEPVEDDAVATVQELFVDPRLRRRGYGALLEGRLTALAKQKGYQSIEFWVDEADARPRNDAARLGFGSYCGWTWEPRSMRRPVVTVVGKKEL